MSTLEKFLIIALFLAAGRMAYAIILRNYKRKNGDDMGVRGRLFAGVFILAVCAIGYGAIEIIDGLHDEPQSHAEKLHMY